MIIPVSVGLLAVILIINFLYNQRTKELEDRNKRLTTLRLLDEIMISSPTDLVEISQKVIDSIPYVLGFEIGFLALVDEDGGLLKDVTISNTPSGIAFKQSLQIPNKNLRIPLSYNQNLAVRVVKENKSQVTNDFYDLFKPILNEQNYRQPAEKVGTSNCLVYPVRAKGKVIGVLAISTSSKHKLSIYNRESLEDLVNVVGIALDNAKVYQKLRLTSALLTDAKQKLKVLDQTKDDFVSVASHELRTPMTAIRSYAWMALHRSDVPLSSNLEKYLARILLSTGRLINLVNDILNVSRIESGRIEINPEPINVLSFIRDIVDEVYYSKSKEKNIQFIVPNKLAPKVFADPEKLRQVFLNLVGNSLKFTPDGGKISFDFFSDGKTVEISVADTGVGILQEDLSKLFHKFGRLDNTYTASATAGGTGLGLYISKHLVERMHGKIWGRSEGLNKGAVFTVALPVATSDVLNNIDKYRIEPKGESKTLEPAAV